MRDWPLQFLLRRVLQGGGGGGGPAFGFRPHGDPAAMMESNQKGLSGGRALERREVAEARQAGAPTPIAPITTTSLTTKGPRAKLGAHPWLHPAAERKGLPTATRS